jgi:hypothetical protein
MHNSTCARTRGAVQQVGWNAPLAFHHPSLGRATTRFSAVANVALDHGFVDNQAWVCFTLLGGMPKSIPPYEIDKSFLVLFFKKELLPSSRT